MRIVFFKKLKKATILRFYFESCKDSNSTIGKVIIPEIDKHKEIIEDAIKKEISV
jgi:hypothetical protein